MRKLKKLKPDRNNIETYLPVFTGFYGSFWDEPDFYGEAEYYGLPEDFNFLEYMNWHAYKNDLSLAFCAIVESEMSLFIEKIEYQILSSPKEYNFINDSINCIIRPKKAAITKFILEHQAAFEVYLKDHLKDRDGFHSFHSFHWLDWYNKTNGFTKFDTDSLDLGFILQFIVEQIDEYNDDLLAGNISKKYEITEKFYRAEIYPSQYYNDSFYKIIEALKGIKDLDFINLDELNKDSDYGDKLPELRTMVTEITEFIQNNYIKLELETLVNAQFSECQYVDIGKLFKSVIGAIESQTLTLELK